MVNSEPLALCRRSVARNDPSFVPAKYGFCACASRDFRTERIVRVQDQCPVRPQRFGECAFFPCNRLTRSHEFDVGDTDVGDDSDIGRSDFGERSNLARMIHSQFPNADLVLRCRLQNRPRKTDVIVEIPFCFRDPEARAENGGDEILRRRFAVAAGDGDDFERKRFSVTRRDLLVGDQRIVDAEERKIRREPYRSNCGPRLRRRRRARRLCR